VSNYTVSERVRQTVDAVRSLSLKYPQGVSITDVAKRLELNKSTITRRVREAVGGGYLCNKATTTGRPAMVVINDPLPDEVEMLPNSAKVASRYNARIKKLKSKRAHVKPTNPKSR
jgi:hypothetical protein